MGTILGNQPMRMRQFLSSSDGMIRPVVRLDSEPPPKVKEFIDRVMKWPLYDIATPLGSFTWEYNKGNFHHWRPLFLHFDDYFKTYISMRKDLTLSNEILSDVPFPKHEVLLILKVMRTILENCPNKSSFSGLEHFNLLLASTDMEVVLATLQTLSALLRINPSKLHVSGKMLGCGSLNGILLSLAQGWGSKEEGLGLFSCIIANEQQVNNSSLHPEIEAQQRLASTLHFEFRAVNNDSVSSSLSVIHIPDLHMWQEDDLVILKQCVKKYNVPMEHRFALLTRIKFARAVRSGSICRDYSRICLLAFIALVQSSDAQDELIAFFANEPEFTGELLKLVRSENAVPEDIRTLAMVALGAHLTAYSSNHDRARILSGSSVVAAGGSRAVLLGVLQKAIASLNNCADSSSTAFISALLNVFLLHVISSSTSGSSMRGSGLVPALLPLLQDVNMAHINLVCTAVKILQKLMDYTNAAVTSFRDLGGVDGLISRLQVEINRVLDESNEKKLRMNTNDPSSSVDDFLYSQKRLIKALLKGLGSATYAATNTGRAPNPQENSLPASLSMIFCNARKFGGDIYFSAVTVMSEMIHKDPTCFPVLYEAGLPEAFLSSVVNGVLPSSKALSCIPSGLGAICLNPRGLEAVREQNALRFLVEACTTRKYLVAINEGIVSLANSLEELLRHVSSLRGTGVDIIIEIIEKLALLGEPSSSTMDNESAMETDLDEKEGQSRIVSLDSVESTQEAITAERFFELCIFHVMLLVHRTMENAETCRLFVEKKGLEAMMKLLLHPNIVQSSEGFSSSFCSASVFRGFMQQHSVPLAKVFCSSLRVHLKKALSAFDSVSGSFMLDPKVPSNKEIFSSLFVVEYLMFLMDASKESRWLTALLNEFGDGAKDVLEDVGRVHREAIWQLALLEDSKLEKKDVNDSSSAQTDRASTTSVALDQRLSTFRQFIDPLLRRRVPGFGIESQLLDFVNLYSDVSRGSSMRRLGIDVLSNMRVGSTHQPQPSSSSDGASASKSESEKQKSFHTSCCDMMRSLFFHVNHLFLELGKVMVLPSRRRDDVPNVTPAAKSVLSTFASIVLDDLNFNGHVDSSKSEPSVSAKCRYMGKIVDFIDVILLDRSDSCNPLLVNCFYSQGVIQSILTTFEATSQLLFTVIRPPASPMELEEGDSKPDEQVEAESSWIYGALASYGLLMDHLVTSSFILAPFTKHLLVQPLSSGTTVPARDAETFVKLLQSKVLKSVLPIWNHPQFPDCSYEFVSSIISIVRHIYSGVEVKNSNSGVGSRTAGPPPDESTVSTIVEMGFSRSRAEEALRQVGINSVEMAMEWLLSHPEEIQEDDELARALAMSLGNAGSSGPEEIAANNVSVDQEVENVHLPPIEELLSSCLRLLQTRENLAYPVRELLLMMCLQNDSQCRAKVIGFILEHLKAWPVIPDYGNDSLLSALFHVLALVLHEDSATREVAAKNGLVMVALDLLAQWEPHVSNRAKCDVPKWVTASLLAIDQMLQVETKWNAELFGSEFAKKDDSESHVSSAHKREDESRISSSERRKLIEIVCRFIWKQLPSETMHVVLQLCATLTRDHAVAVNFLESGGLVSLISLPPSSLFAGFDGIASSIVRHILEDPHTLQQAMEFEIRHTLLASLNRHPSGRMTPRNFLSNMASVISRDPCVFMLAAQSVCQIEMVGERPYVVLAKDRDKERNKEKEKPSEKDNKLLNVDTKAAPGETNAAGTPSGNSHVKQLDANCKSFKSHKKAPQSFVTVIELLLDNVLAFNPPKDDTLTEDHHTSSSSQMDIDVATSKGKGKALASVSDENKPGTAEISATLAKMVFILKLLSEILLTYASSIHILLRKDLEAGNFRGQVLREAAANRCAGIFQHVLHKFLPYSLNPKKDKKEGDWKHKLGSKASQFLVASAVRSTEARRRIFSEINAVCGEFVEISSSNDSKKPNSEIQVFVDLLNEILVARSPNGSFISAEAALTFTDVGLVTSMTRILQVLDLDHGDSQRIVTMIVKALESVTKEHVHSSDSSSSKGDASNQASLQNRTPGTDSDNIMRLGDSNLRPVNDERLTVSVEPFIGGQTAGSLDSIADLMDHDRDLDGNIVPEADDDFMHENSDVAGGLDNGITSVGITFEIQQNPQDNMVDDEDDEEMSEDGGDDVDEDEDDEDDQDNEDLDEEVHHMSHQDADHDDHEIDEDEFDEDIMDEDDEDDEDDENGLILRLEDGINGINVLDHIEVFSRNNLSNEGLHVMPVEIFGSRRQGRTTSIYNLLGRTGDQGIPIRHPLLTEPSLSTHSAVHRQSGDNVNDLTSTEQITENSSSDLDAIFRSLRSGRQGSRLSMWTDDSQLRGGANAALITQSMEEAFVSHLSKPNPSQPSDKPDTVAQSEQKTVSVELRHEPPSDSMIDNSNQIVQPSASMTISANENVEAMPVSHEFLQEEHPIMEDHAVDMQYEHGDVVIRDVEAVSQESGGSGATIGESLRSLEVEIGSADGHEDGADRQSGTDRLQLGDSQLNRSRQAGLSLGNNLPVNESNVLHETVNETSNDPNLTSNDSDTAEMQEETRIDSSAIDPAFLEALPEDLRAEVLQAQRSQVVQPPNEQAHSTEDIDPEFLAALPPDIRAEVLAQQQAQRLQASQELEGQPVEMDTVSIIATFPSDLREEVLLTSDNSILANLTPALMAEANLLRERFAHRYHSRGIFGIRNRRGEPSGRVDSISDRVGGTTARQIGVKVPEAEGAPIVDTDALKALVRLLRIFQPLYKSHLQRLLLNLCAHRETRTALVQILMDMLMLDVRGPGKSVTSSGELTYRLYGCQNCLSYSRPQFLEGVPPLLSRRILETLTYLSRHHPQVAKLLLHHQLLQPSGDGLKEPDSGRGKAVLSYEDETAERSYSNSEVAIVLLLSLLNQPLYLRSVAHLEQLLNLLEVVIDNAQSNSSSQPKSGVAQQPPSSSTAQILPDIPQQAMDATDASGSSSNKLPSSEAGPSNSALETKDDDSTILNHLPDMELRLLCSLLAQEGLSDSAYVVAAEVLKKIVAIAPMHSVLFVNELAGSVRNLIKSAMDELKSYGEAQETLVDMALAGSAVLRVVQALTSLVSSLLEKEKDPQCVSGEQQSDAIMQVWEINTTLEPLWLELSNCISKIESNSDTLVGSSQSSHLTSMSSSALSPLPAGSQNILPYIESFFVACEKLHPGQTGGNSDIALAVHSDAEEASTSTSGQKSQPSIAKFDEKHAAFVRFAEKHRRLLNSFIRQNPVLLEKSFSLMLKVPRFVEFDNKRAHFRSKIKHQHDHHQSPLRISVRRAYILEDSYNQLRMRSAQELKGRLTVHFQGEEGIDAGGLTREWYQVLSRVVFDKGALLFTTVGNESTFQPNPNSVYQTEHLSYFKFVGRVVAKALFDGQLLDVHFTRSFYKHILGVKVTYHDIEAIDPDYFKNLKWVLENDISDMLDLTFSIDADEEKLILYERNEVTDHELVPGGRNIRVTEENKHEYVGHVAEHRLTTAIRPQINSFLEGFNELIPRDLISIFNDKELELLISGLPDIDLDDMRANTEYSGYTVGSPVIQWFWEVVQSFSKEDKARLLQFVTGTSKVPLEGFSALQGISGSQRFQIHKAYGSAGHLPSAHTCFNQLDLPEYPSKEQLQERLLLAIHEANEGFGFG